MSSAKRDNCAQILRINTIHLQIFIYTYKYIILFERDDERTECKIESNRIEEEEVRY